MNEYLIIFLVGIVPCLIVGIWQTCVGCMVISRARKSLDWQMVRGKLTPTESILSGDEVAFHLPDALQISYRVEGHHYHCQKLHLYENWKQRGALLQQLSTAQAVPVYYNPAKPQEAVVERGIKPHYWLPLILGISSLTMALLGSFFLAVGS